MRVIRYIRIKKEKVKELLKLDAVERIELWRNGNIVVFLNPENTEGKREVIKDEYLIQWENGKWQRYGSEAFLHLCHNPNEIGKL